MKVKDSFQNGRVKMDQKLSSTTPTIATYFVALRPWSFSASLVPVLLGTALAYKSQYSVDLLVLGATAISVLSVHGAGNLVNTYYDYKKGVDNEESEDRTLVDRKLPPGTVATFGASLYGVGCVAIFVLAVFSTAKIEHIALLYFGGLSGSFLYTGGVGLKYHALGDIVILITFGPLSVMFAFMTQVGKLEIFPLLYAIPLAMITEAILHANNSRDQASDKRVHATTIAMLIGPTMSYILYCFLLFVPFITLTVLGVNFSKMFLAPLLSLPVAFNLEKEFRKGRLYKLPQKTAKLNLIFGLLYISAVLLADDGSLPSL